MSGADRRSWSGVARPGMFLRAAEHADDPPRQPFLDLSVTGNRLCQARCRVPVPVVLPTVANELAAEQQSSADPATSALPERARLDGVRCSARLTLPSAARTHPG